MFILAGYRDWAKMVYRQLVPYFSVTLIDNPKSLNAALENDTEGYFRAIFFVGWSWMVEDEILSKYPCYCIHPSPLPKYRGGSPIQNQILNGEKESAVTLFRMTPEMDAGPIVSQAPLSLEGDLWEILVDVTHKSTQFIDYVMYGYTYGGSQYIEEVEQDHSQATYCKRRKPSDSEITFTELLNLSAEELYNKIRCLQDPYPNAYIKCSDGSKLFITGAHLE